MIEELQFCNLPGPLTYRVLTYLWIVTEHRCRGHNWHGVQYTFWSIVSWQFDRLRLWVASRVNWDKYPHA